MLNIITGKTLWKEELSESLIKIEKKDDACATLNQFLIKYPYHELIKKINLKINDLQCS